MSPDKIISLYEKTKDTLFPKMETNDGFYRERVGEWIKTNKTPSIYTSSQDPRLLFGKLNDELTFYEGLNAIRKIGPDELFHVKDLLSGLDDLFKKKNLHPINKSLIHNHKAWILFREGRLGESLNEYDLARKVVIDCVSNNIDGIEAIDDRENILILGRKSLVYLAQNEYEKAIDVVNNMAKLAVIFSKNEKLVSEEKKYGWCPILSWTYYYECNVLVSAWNKTKHDTKLEQDMRDCLSRTFEKRHHHYWSLPTLLSIANSVHWRSGFPDAQNEIAKLSYIGTSPNATSRILRKLKASFGMRDFDRAAWASVIVGLFACYYLFDNGNSGTKNVGDLLHYVEACVDKIFALDDLNLNQDFAESVKQKARECISASNGNMNYLLQELEKVLSNELIEVAVNSNEKVIRLINSPEQISNVEPT